jgi:hypothetical protein
MDPIVREVTTSDPTLVQELMRLTHTINSVPRFGADSKGLLIYDVSWVKRIREVILFTSVREETYYVVGLHIVPCTTPDVFKENDWKLIEDSTLVMLGKEKADE